MSRDFVPLIDRYSCKMREELQALEKGLDMVITSQKEQISKLYEHIQGAVLLWDDQKNAMEKASRTFQVRTNSTGAPTA